MSHTNRTSARGFTPALLAALSLAAGCPLFTPAERPCTPDNTCAPGYTLLDGDTCTCVLDRFTPDAGVLPSDAGPPDAGMPDAGEPDAGLLDAGEPDAGRPDAGMPDAGRPDAGMPDAGLPDAGMATLDVLLTNGSDSREPPEVNDTLECATENEPDNTVLAFAWTIDGTDAGEATDRLVVPLGTAAGTVITCTITATRDAPPVVATGTGSVTVADTPAVVTFETSWENPLDPNAPQGDPRAGDVYTCDASYTDVNGPPGSSAVAHTEWHHGLPVDHHAMHAPIKRHERRAVLSGPGYCVARIGDDDVGYTDDAGDAVTPRLPDALSVHAGRAHTCVQTHNGRLQCIGANDHGQIADGTVSTTNAHWLTSKTATALAVGGDYTCIIAATGRVLCKGANDEGQLGDGTTTPRATPAIVQTATGPLEDVVALSTGPRHACAITGGTTGSSALFCWGANDRGQLAGDTSSGMYTPFATAVLLPNVLSVTAGPGHTCAALDRDADGIANVACWGENGQGQLGRGHQNDSPGIQDTRFGADLEAWNSVDLVLGTGHTCAYGVRGQNRQVYCWGNHAQHQFPSAQAGPVSRPSRINAFAGTLDMAAGAEFTCVETADHQVKCMGANDKLQTGSGVPATPTTVPTTVFGPGGLTSALVIRPGTLTAGQKHACAIAADGRVVCWGSQDANRTGAGAAVAGTLPVFATAFALDAP